MVSFQCSLCNYADTIVAISIVMLLHLNWDFDKVTSFVFTVGLCVQGDVVVG